MKLKNFLLESEPSKDKIIEVLLKDCAPYLNSISIKNKKDFNQNMIKFYRGMKTKINNLEKVKVSKRFSKGTIDFLFPVVNKWLKENGHVSRDLAVFATSDKDYTEIFGSNIGIIFPIGKINYTFVKSNDFNNSDYMINGWDSFALIWKFKEKLIKLNKQLFYADIWYKDNLEEFWNEDLLKYIKVNGLKDEKNNEIKINIYGITSGGIDTDTYEGWNLRTKTVLDNFETNQNILKAYKNNYEIWFDCKEYYFIDPKIF